MPKLSEQQIARVAWSYSETRQPESWAKMEGALCYTEIMCNEPNII